MTSLLKGIFCLKPFVSSVVWLDLSVWAHTVPVHSCFLPFILKFMGGNKNDKYWLHKGHTHFIPPVRVRVLIEPPKFLL